MKLRMLIGAGVLVSGVVHLRLWFDGFREIALIGPAFLLNAAAAVAIAGLLVFWRHWIPLLLGLGFGASTLGAYLISATVGLFGYHETWSGGPVLTAAISEIVVIVAAAVALSRELRRPSPAHTRRPFSSVHPPRVP